MPAGLSVAFMAAAQAVAGRALPVALTGRPPDAGPGGHLLPPEGKRSESNGPGQTTQRLPS